MCVDSSQFFLCFLARLHRPILLVLRKVQTDNACIGFVKLPINGILVARYYVSGGKIHP